MSDLDREMPYVIRKAGYFYRHNSAGYCSSVFEAELYTKEYAENHAERDDEISVSPVTDWFNDYEKECFERIDEMKAALEAIKGSE